MTERVCDICGKTFIPKSPRRLYCYEKHPVECCICGKMIEDWGRAGRERATCSEECEKERKRRAIKKRVEKVKKTMLERYGSTSSFNNPELRKKAKETKIKKYGVDGNPEKMRQTCLERYGVPVSSQAQSVKDKNRQTCLERYGSTSNFSNPEARKKQVETGRQRYGTATNRAKAVKTSRERFEEDNYNNRKQFVETCRQIQEETGSWNNRERFMKTVFEKFGVSTPLLLPENREKAIVSLKRSVISKTNKVLGKMLEDLGIDFEYEKFISPYYYDLAVEEKKLLIEINPTITHNSMFSVFDKDSKGKEADYHYKKTRAARQAGYICLNVWDWNSWEEVIEIIKNLEKYQIIQESEPRKVWSKGSEKILDSNLKTEDERTSLIEQKYLLIYDDGQNFILKE